MLFRSRTCEKSGNVNYVRKETNPETGAVIFTSVEYNGELGKFINVSPSESKSCCKGMKATSCCAGKSKATSADAGTTSEMTKQVKVQKGS